MPFEVGNRHAVGHGRPPDLGVALRKIEEAAGAIETRLGLLALAQDSGWPEGRLAELANEIVSRRLALAEQVEALVATAKEVQSLAASAPAPRGRRARRRHRRWAALQVVASADVAGVKLHADARSMEVATLAVALAGILPEGRA